MTPRLWDLLLADLEARPDLAPRIAEFIAPYLAPSAPNSGNELLTVREAAATAGVCEETIRRKVKAGELPDRRVGGRIRIARSDLDALLAAPERTPERSRPARRRSGGTVSSPGAMAEAFRALDF